MQFTINGCHLNEAGDREVAVALDRALFGETTAANMDSDDFQKLRAAVNDKSWVHVQDYRMLNGWYVYGGRRTWDTETFPREFQKIRAMAAVRDRYVWDLAQGKNAGAARRQRDRRAVRARHAVRQSAAGLFGAREAGLPDAGRVRQDDESAGRLRGAAVRQRERIPRVGQARSAQLR